MFTYDTCFVNWRNLRLCAFFFVNHMYSGAYYSRINRSTRPLFRRPLTTSRWPSLHSSVPNSSARRGNVPSSTLSSKLLTTRNTAQRMSRHFAICKRKLMNCPSDHRVLLIGRRHNCWRKHNLSMHPSLHTRSRSSRSARRKFERLRQAFTSFTKYSEILVPLLASRAACSVRLRSSHSVHRFISLILLASCR